MASLKDDRGYNQGFRPSKALNIRTQRRCEYIISQMDDANNPSEILEIGCGTGELSFMLATKTQKRYWELIYAYHLLQKLKTDISYQICRT